MKAADWPGLADFVVQRRWPLLAAAASFALYFGAVVAGSVAQGALRPEWTMGWLQQVAGLAAVLVIAAALGSPRQLLGLAAPKARWLAPSIMVGISITLAGLVADLVVRSPPAHPGIEYFAYQATIPGLSEEFAFRGLLLGLLATAALQRGRSDGGGWLLLIVAALPFAGLHILEATGWPLVALVFYTVYAGVALGWLRLTQASIWPAILAHNIANCGSGLTELIFR